MFKRSTLAPLFTVALLSLPAVAQAESFKSLTGQGYSVGPLAKNKAGMWGWTFVKSSNRYFCEMKVGVAYSGKKGMIGFTSSGRTISIDRASYEANIGGPDASLPKYEDLKAGRLRASDVGSCRKQS